MKLMLDPFSYTEKPYNQEGHITYRIVKNLVDITPQQLAQEILSGKTFVAGVMIEKDGHIYRRIDNWHSQQIICLDFDNTDKDKNKYITMTLEDARAEFKNTAMFIYTSFNHIEDHPRFRVVFALEKEVHNYSVFSQIMQHLLSKYPNADPKCSDGSRLWYGGKNLIELNYSNRLRIDEMNIDYESQYIPEKRNTNIRKRQPLIVQGQTHFEMIRLLESQQLSDILISKRISADYISSKKVEFDPSPLLFHTLDEVEDYLRRQDLSELLNVPMGNNFCCLFHDDHNPSANIFLDTREGRQPYWYYKCRSAYCKNNNGLDILSFVEKLADTKRHIARKFLMRVFNIQFVESDWKKEQREILEDNIRLLMNDDWIKNTYPFAYKRFKRHLDKLILLNTHAKDRIFTENHTDAEMNPIFRASQSEMIKILKYSPKQNDKMNKTVNLFVFCHLLNKIADDQIPTFLLSDAKRWAQIHGHSKHTSFYSIPAYSTRLLEKVEEKARSIKARNVKVETMTLEGIKRTFGVAEANRVFPQLEDREYSEASRDFEAELDRELPSLVLNNRYTTVDELIHHIHFNPSKYLNKHGSVLKTVPSKKNMLDRMLPEALDKYSMQKIRATNQMKNDFHIESKGNPSIIIPL